jgi:hypothetical protein
VAYPDVVRGLVEVIEGMNGIAAVHDYEPTSIGNTPTAYLLLDGAERVSKGGISAFRYSILLRVVFNWIDNEQAEREVMQFVNPVTVAIERGASLNGALTHGMAGVTRVQAVFVVIGGVLYRALDFYLGVLEKGARGETI